MEHVSFEERNLMERRTFHQIQTRLRYCRIAIIALIVTGLIEVCFSMTHSYHKYMQLNSRMGGRNQLLTGHEIQNEVYNISVVCLFFVVNAFGVIAVLFESFLLVMAFTVFNVGIFLLSFTADNSLPHGLIFKLILLLIIQLTVVFFLLMKSRRLS